MILFYKITRPIYMGEIATQQKISKEELIRGELGRTN